MKPAPVSALMPVRNAEAFVADAIDSVLAQTCPVAELIIVDDGSTDNTVVVAEGRGVKVIRQTHSGLSATRNRCVSESTQPWVAFIDGDDIWNPEKIEKQMRIAESDLAIALVTCDYSVFDSTGTITPSILEKYSHSYRAQPKTKCEGGVVIERLDESFSDVAYVLMPSFVMVRRDALDRTGLFDESLFVAEDFDCFLRVLAGGKFAVAESILAKRREHTTNTSRHFTMASLSCLEATFKVLRSPELYPEAAVRLCRKWLPANLRHAGVRLISDGEGSKGRDLLMQSARLKFSWRTLLALAASLAPRAVGRELMKARYYVSDTLGI